MLISGWAGKVVVIGLSLLLVGFIGLNVVLVIGLGDPPPPDDHLYVDVRLDTEEVENGTYLVGLAANDAAVDPSSDNPELELALIHVTAGTRAELRAGDGGTVTVTPRPGWTTSRGTTPVARCDVTCLQIFEFDVERAAADHDVELIIAAGIRYQAGRDSVPDGAALALWVERPSGAETGTVGSEPITLLTADDRPRQVRTAAFEMSREHVPEGEIAADGTLSAVWRGGAVVGIVPADTQATVTLETTERVVIDVSGQRPDRGSFYGLSLWQFDMPFTLTCDQSVCRSEWAATLELHHGAWALLGWGGSYGSRLVTEAGTPLHTWTRDVAP